MTLGEAREEYYSSSGTLSTITRNLSVIGVGIVWAFGSDLYKDDVSTILKSNLAIPGLFFVYAILFDILQYAYKTLVWGFYKELYWKREVKNQCKDPWAVEVDPPRCINWMALFFFWGKSFFCLVGYLLLLWALYR